MITKLHQRLFLLILLLTLFTLSVSVTLAGEPPHASYNHIPVADDCGDTCNKVPDDPFFIAGTEVAYHLVLTNTTTGIIAGPAVITDVLPIDLQYSGFRSADWTCTPQSINNSVLCDANATLNLAPGESTTVTLELDLAAAAGPVITNTAEFKFPLATGGFKVLERSVSTPVFRFHLYLPLVVR